MACVCIVVPCYNEAERLAPREFCDFQLQGHELRFLFVDDGSTDATAEVLRSMVEACPERAGSLALAQNSGKAEAVRRGLLAAAEEGADYLGFWDADLATPLTELPRFVERMEEDSGRLAVLGARVRLLGRVIDRRPYRHAYGRVFATAVSTLLGLPIYDSQCGAKLFRAGDALSFALREPFLSRWIFDVELLARLIAFTRADALDLSDRVFELPLNEWRDVAGSKIRTRDAARAFRELGAIGLRYREALSARRRGL